MIGMRNVALGLKNLASGPRHSYIGIVHTWQLDSIHNVFGPGGLQRHGPGMDAKEIKINGPIA